MAQTFREIKAWQAAYEVVLVVYRLTAQFPQSELYGLVSQLRRAAVSVTLNIAEGFKRRSTAEARHLYNIGQASLEEVRCAILISKDLGYCNEGEYHHVESLCEKAAKLLHGWTQSQRTEH